MTFKKPSDKQCNHDLQIVLMSYKGVITKKYVSKVNDIEVFTGQHFYTEYMVTREIYDAAQIGDSIFKIKNQNFAILKRGNTSHKYEYISLLQDCESLKKYYSEAEDEESIAH
ncbi:MAG: hypothetical protein ACXWDO_00220 [Bacteroidia bacterium]